MPRLARGSRKRAPKTTYGDGRRGNTQLLQGLLAPPPPNDRALYVGKRSDKPQGQSRFALRNAGKTDVHVGPNRVAFTTTFNDMTLPMTADGLGARAPSTLEEAEIARFGLAASMQVLGVVTKDTVGPFESTVLSVGGVTQVYVDCEPMPPGTPVYVMPPPLLNPGQQQVPLYTDPDAAPDVHEHYPVLVSGHVNEQDFGTSFRFGRLLHLMESARNLPPDAAACVANMHHMNNLCRTLNFGTLSPDAGFWIHQLYYNLVKMAAHIIAHGEQHFTFIVPAFADDVHNAGQSHLSVRWNPEANGHGALRVRYLLHTNTEQGFVPTEDNQFTATDKYLGRDAVRIGRAQANIDHDDIMHVRAHAFAYAAMVHVVQLCNARYPQGPLVPPELDGERSVHRWLERVIGTYCSMETMFSNQYAGIVLDPGTVSNPYPTILAT